MKRISFLLLLSFAFIISACSKDDPEPPVNPVNPNEDGYLYLIGVSSENQSYVLTTQTLEEGKLTIAGHGKRVIDAEPILFDETKAFVFEYRKGDPAGFQSVKVDKKGEIIRGESSVLSQRKDFSTVLPPYMVAVNSGQQEKNTGKIAAVFMFVNGKTDVFENEAMVITEDVIHKGEYFNFCGILPLDENRFMSTIEPFKFNGRNEKGGIVSSDTQFPDEMNVAILKKEGNQVKIEKIISDDRASFAVGRRRSGRMNCLVKGSNGDIYAFSPAFKMGKKKEDGSNEYYKVSKYPSSVLKINKGSMNFDKGYYFNLEEKAEGYKLQNIHPLYGDFVLLNFYADKEKNYNMATAFKYAIFELSTGNFKWIEGLPKPEDIAGHDPTPTIIGTHIYFPLSAKGQGNVVYLIDAEKAAAKKGLEIEGDISLGRTVRLKTVD